MAKTWDQYSSIGKNFIIALTFSFLGFFICLQLFGPVLKDIWGGTEMTCEGGYNDGCGYTWHVKAGDTKNQTKCPKCGLEIPNYLIWDQAGNDSPIIMTLLFGLPVYCWFIAWLPIWLIMNTWEKAEDKVINFIKK